jgi:hypothetical protein
MQFPSDKYINFKMVIAYKSDYLLGNAPFIHLIIIGCSTNYPLFQMKEKFK